jgi:hypothetical protein
MSTDLLVESHKAAAFVERHWPQSLEWPDVIGWAAWYISNGFMAALHRADGTIAALAAARPVNDPDDGYIPYKHIKSGEFIFVDFLAIEDHAPLALTAFAMLLNDRFGERKKIVYLRTHEYDYQNFVRNLGRIKQIGEPTYGPTTTP